MATASIEPFLKGDTGRNTRGLLRLIILCTIAAAAVASRLFSVISKSFMLMATRALHILRHCDSFRGYLANQSP